MPALSNHHVTRRVSHKSCTCANRSIIGGEIGSSTPSTATVLRRKDDDVLTIDGPYVEGKEHLGGFTIVRAPDLDAALEWGRKLATAIQALPIEVRPFQDSIDD